MTAYQQQPPRDPTAVMGRRTGAFVVDGLLLTVPTGIVASADFEYVREENMPVPIGDFCDLYLEQNDGACFQVGDRAYFTDQVSPAASLVFFGLLVVLLVVLQGLRGTTPGKALFGLRTVDPEGRPPGLGRAAGRTAMWIVDGAPWVIPGLVGFVAGVSSPGHRRVGDMAAKTFVVSRADAGRQVVAPGIDTGLPGGPASLAGGREVYQPPPEAAHPPPPGTGPSPTPPPGAIPLGPASTGSPPATVPAGTATTGTAADDRAVPVEDPSAGSAVDATSREAGSRSGPTGAAADQGRAGTSDAGATSAYQPQWDPVRQTYIVWEPYRRQWLGWDESRREWRPL